MRYRFRPMHGHGAARAAIGLAIVAVALSVGIFGLLARGGANSRDLSQRLPTEDVATATERGPAQSPADETTCNIDHARLHPGFDPQAPCTCATAIRRGGWCWRCNVGYIAGECMKNAMLFETLDPHGHQLDLNSIQFDMCRDAIRLDGYCEAVGIGFVKGMAYFTRLTYGLARGRPIEPSDVECSSCRAHVAEPGWCPRCRHGIVGSVVLEDRDTFEHTAREYAVLLAAIERAATCELCACAMVVHRTCPQCLISYRKDPFHGVPAPPPGVPEI